MNQKRQIINLFNIYTILSISISMVAWLTVILGFVNVPSSIINRIGTLEMVLAITIFVLGLANVWTLSKTKEFNNVLFLFYLRSQVLVLILSFVQQGWLFFPAAGSQGTIPAIIITTGMYFFLRKQSKKETLVIT